MLRLALCSLVVTGLFGLTASSAAPVVSWVDGTLDDGANLTVFGADFGEKIPAAPLKYDDFDSGIPGQVLDEGPSPGWNLWAAISPPDDPYAYYPKYSTNESRFPGDVCALQAFGDTPDGYLGNCSLGLTNVTSRQLYVHGYTIHHRSPNGEATGARNVKIWQRCVGAWGYPTTRWDVYPMNGSGHLYSQACASGVADANQWGIGMPEPDNWFRVEIYHDRGTSSAPEIMEVYQDLQLRRSFSNPGQPDCGQDRLYLMSYHSDLDDNGAWMDWYWSEIYIDVTRARVEIGNAPTWDACTHREIQIPTAWQGGQLSFTANLNTFTPDSQVYLYVVNADGEVNQSGHGLIVGENAGGEDPGPPTEPGTPIRQTRD